MTKYAKKTSPSVSTTLSLEANSELRGRPARTGSRSATAVLIALFMSAVSVSR